MMVMSKSDVTSGRIFVWLIDDDDKDGNVGRGTKRMTLRRIATSLMTVMTTTTTKTKTVMTTKMAKETKPRRRKRRRRDSMMDEIISGSRFCDIEMIK